MKNTKERIWRIASLILAVLMLATALCACNGGTEVESPVLECGDIKIPRSFYQLMLSRTKGDLARAQIYDLDSDEFWEKKADDGDLTVEEQLNAAVLENCKRYLAAAVMFDEAGYKLSEQMLADIDEEIGFYVDYDGRGSREKLDEILAPFGFDADDLREAYIIEAKYEYMIAALYGANGSLIADTVKEEYYNGNYYRFKQVLFANYYYEYQRDEEGNLIYFDTSTGKPLYDDKNGEPKFNADGSYVKDSFGCAIYYGEDGKPIYDSENGQLSVILDTDGTGKEFYYTEDELKEREETAKELFASLETGNTALFEASMKKHNAVWGYESYPDGYYLSDKESAGYDAYLIDIFEEVKSLEIGEIAYHESEYGIHLIMRYPLDGGKYSDSAYAQWFENFVPSIISDLFVAKCNSMADRISEVEENLSGAKSIRDVGANFDY